MRPYAQRLIFVVLVVISPIASGDNWHVENDAQVLANCPPQGDAVSERVKPLNILKRRMDFPAPDDINSDITLQAILSPGDDWKRWSSDKAATVEGYVANVIVGGVETVNCHTHDPKYRDTHIELTLDPLHDDETKHMIVEVTPQWRNVMQTKGLDWSTEALRRTLLGRWIRVTGWMFFDEEHSSQSRNTAPPENHIWRATAWEIHPIVLIEILPEKPAP
jgi:hypothetical protein